MTSGLSARGHGPAVPRILLVDDDRDLLVPLAEQLRLDGFDVTTARDGEEALRRLDSAWPDLLIIDLLMPRMDGLTLAREIKARADLPIIVLSAIDAGDNKADLLDEFAEDYITKPYHYSELRARIQRVLRRVGDRVPRKGLDLGPDLILELHQRRAIVGGKPVQLTPTESRLLFALAANLEQIVTIDPVYPAAAMRDRVEGWVTLEFTVMPTGAVGDILVTDSEPSGVFDAAATRAVSQWRFKPRVSGGRAVAMRSSVTLRFDVDQ